MGKRGERHSHSRILGSGKEPKKLSAGLKVKREAHRKAHMISDNCCETGLSSISSVYDGGAHHKYW
jgi:hypothetical protein